VEVKIRKFQLSDMKELLEIEKFSFPKSPYSEATFLSWYEIAKDTFLVAEVEKKIVGYIIGFCGSEVGIVVSIAVHPNFRRKGIGTKLWKELLKLFKNNNVKIAQLEVRKSNSIAQNFYKKIGFKKIGVIKNYYENGEDAIVMVCKL
jgi:ribosomal-protein-alanine N-acetyltransferase